MYEPELWSHFAMMLASACVVAIAAEAVTEIIVASKLFRPLHQFLARRAVPKREEGDPEPEIPWYWTKPYELLTCGYCSSVWVSVLAFTMPGEWFSLVLWDNIFVKMFLVHRLSNIFHAGYQIFSRGRVVPREIYLNMKVDHDGKMMVATEGSNGPRPNGEHRTGDVPPSQ